MTQSESKSENHHDYEPPLPAGAIIVATAPRAGDLVNERAKWAAYETGTATSRLTGHTVLWRGEPRPTIVAPVTRPSPTRLLTPKQLEALELAHKFGFYNTPRDGDLSDLAHVLGISKAAVHNRLQGAERVVISEFLTALHGAEAAIVQEVAK